MESATILMSPSTDLSGIHLSVRTQYSQHQNMKKYQHYINLNVCNVMLYKVYDISSIVLVTKQENMIPL